MMIMKRKQFLRNLKNWSVKYETMLSGGEDLKIYLIFVNNFKQLYNRAQTKCHTCVLYASQSCFTQLLSFRSKDPYRVIDCS